MCPDLFIEPTDVELDDTDEEYRPLLVEGDAEWEDDDAEGD